MKKNDSETNKKKLEYNGKKYLLCTSYVYDKRKKNVSILLAIYFFIHCKQKN